MKVLIDLNLPPGRHPMLEAQGHRARPASGAAKYGAHG